MTLSGYFNMVLIILETDNLHICYGHVWISESNNNEMYEVVGEVLINTMT